MMSWTEKPIEPKSIEVKLDMYNNAETFYRSNDSMIGQTYKIVTESFSGKAIEVKDTSISEGKIEFRSIHYK